MTNCGCTAGDELDPTSKNAGLASVTPGSSSTDEPPTDPGSTDTTRAWVVARLTAACRLLAASRRGSTCSECVAPAHTVNPTTTATSATDGRDRHPHGWDDAHAPPARDRQPERHRPRQPRRPPAHRRQRGRDGADEHDPQGRADGQRRQEAGLHDPRLAMCSMMPVVDTDGVRGR